MQQIYNFLCHIIFAFWIFSSEYLQLQNTLLKSGNATLIFQTLGTYLMERSEGIAWSCNPDTEYWERKYRYDAVLIGFHDNKKFHLIQIIDEWFDTDEYYNYTTNTCAEFGACSPYLKVNKSLVSKY